MEPRPCIVNTAKKYSGWMLAALLIAWTIFPEWTGGQYFGFSVLLAALGTLTLWVSLVLFASWVFCVCGCRAGSARGRSTRGSPSDSGSCATRSIAGSSRSARDPRAQRERRERADHPKQRQFPAEHLHRLPQAPRRKPLRRSARAAQRALHQGGDRLRGDHRGFPPAGAGRRALRDAGLQEVRFRFDFEGTKAV